MKKVCIFLFIMLSLFIGLNTVNASSINKSNLNSEIASLKSNDTYLNLSEVVATNDLEESIENSRAFENISDILSFESLKDINFQELMLNPLKLFWILIQAFGIVIGINIGAKLVCKFLFNSSDVIKRRYKTRKLDKVLEDLYSNSSIYDFEE